MNNGGLNNAAFYDDSSEEELDIIEGENQAFGLGMNRPVGGGGRVVGWKTGTSM